MVQVVRAVEMAPAPVEVVAMVAVAREVEVWEAAALAVVAMVVVVMAAVGRESEELGAVE